jgi:hypothetical protein
VKSATRFWFAPVAVKSRSTRSGAARATHRRRWSCETAADTRDLRRPFHVIKRAGDALDELRRELANNWASATRTG